MTKIIAIIDNEIGAGGGFDQALNAILQIKKLSVNKFELLVFTTKKSNLFFLNKLGIQAIKIEISFFDKLLARLSGISLWHDLQKHIRFICPFEKKLIRHGCDLAYFVTPSNLPAALQKLNYIFTLWDLCHRETPEFPEVRDFNTFFIREKNYKHNLAPAFLILTESKRTINLASHYYGIDFNRFLSMPLSATPFIDQIHSESKQSILKKYSLKKSYFYYPAQFWAHKNHIRILQALIILRDNHNSMPNVVFSGKDYGNLNYIEQFINANNLTSQVKILGFVPSQDLRGLYENASAIVMPTYFGPTNLPPLEAWSLGIPLIYSSHISEWQVKNAALLVDPDNSDEIAKAMILSTILKVRKRLISNGYNRLFDISRERKNAEKKFSEIINKFLLRRECWKI